MNLAILFAFWEGRLAATVPQRFDTGDHRAASVQLRFPRLSPKNYGTTRWNRYAYQQAAIP
jgi:hypothetical protein